MRSGDGDDGAVARRLDVTEAWARARRDERREAQRLAEKVLSAARAAGDAELAGEALMTLTLIAYREGAPRRALEHASAAQEEFARVPLHGGNARSLNSIGLCLYDLGDCAGAVDRLERARVVAVRTGERACELNCLNNLAIVYGALGRHADAVETYETVLAARRIDGAPRGLADVLANLAVSLRRLGEPARALAALDEAMELHRRLDDPTCELAALDDWIGIQLEADELEAVDRGLRRCAELEQRVGRHSFVVDLLLLRAERSRRQAAREPSAEEPLERAREFLEQALAVAGEQQLTRMVPPIHERLYALHKQAGRFEDALRHHEQFSRLQRELETREAGDRAAGIKALHDVERSREQAVIERSRAEELARLNAEIEQQHRALADLSAELAAKVRELEAEMHARQQTEAERLRLERQMLETQKIESLGVIAGGVAHDFNNLLTVMSGHASLVASMDGVPEGAGRSLDSIQAAVRRAAALCRQMLEYAGNAPCAKQPLDLNAAVAAALPLAMASASKKCGLSSELAPHVSAVSADPAQLTQIVVQLVVNAAEAIGDRPGRVRVRTAQVDLSEAEVREFDQGATLKAGSWVVLEVVDDGPGLAPGIASRVFEPFFTTKFTGRGLGLPAVLGIVRTHGGGVSLQSRPGDGCRVRVALPPLAQAAVPSAVPPVTRQGHQGGLVLLADDEEAVRDLAGLMLKQMGFEVLAVSDGAAAVAAVRANPDQVVTALLDFKMPGLDGGEAWQQIRRLRPGLRGIMMSGYREHDALAASCGDLVFLPKPFTTAQLADALRVTLATGEGS